jgi:hypothetical protein
MSWRLILIVIAVIANPTSGLAQASSAAQQVAFDSPEAWAMKYFTSATALNGLETPEDLGAGALAIGVEGGWLPKLSTAQERVGFNGTSPEDLNQTQAFLRPRAAFGVRPDLAIVAAYDPPVHAFGVRPQLFALGVDGVLHRSPGWRIGWRAHGQVGTVTAAVTCPSAILGFAPGSSGNPAGCTAKSADETTLRYVGGEIRIARVLSRGLVPHAAIGVNVVDTVFQTIAETYGQPDRTRLRARGAVVAATVGIGYRLGDRLTVATDFFYAPLTVSRDQGASSSIDPMMNARAVVMYKVLR